MAQTITPQAASSTPPYTLRITPPAALHPSTFSYICSLPASPDLSSAANVGAHETHFVFVSFSSVREVSPHGIVGGRLKDEVDVRGVDEVFLARGVAPFHRWRACAQGCHCPKTVD